MLEQDVALVSIHSRPHDRLQLPRGNRPALTIASFQSTAGPMTGCNRGTPWRVADLLVSIHSRPHDRLQRRVSRANALPARLVSIHSRPHDRLQREVPYTCARFQSFNPQPAP